MNASYFRAQNDKRRQQPARVALPIRARVSARGLYFYRSEDFFQHDLVTTPLCGIPFASPAAENLSGCSRANATVVVYLLKGRALLFYLRVFPWLVAHIAIAKSKCRPTAFAIPLIFMRASTGSIFLAISVVLGSLSTRVPAQQVGTVPPAALNVSVDSLTLDEARGFLQSYESDKLQVEAARKEVFKKGAKATPAERAKLIRAFRVAQHERIESIRGRAAVAVELKERVRQADKEKTRAAGSK
jgi:hypothetical protein